jgi:hypothetical protein
MTPRQAKLVAASAAVDTAKARLQRIIPTLEQSIADAWALDIAALDLASKTVMAIAEDPDAYGLLMKLRAEKPADFQAIMVLVRIELERPAPAETKVAA